MLQRLRSLQNGARVVVAGRRGVALEETISGFGTEYALAIASDLANRAAVESLVSQSLATAASSSGGVERTFAGRSNGVS